MHIPGGSRKGPRSALLDTTVRAKGPDRSEQPDADRHTRPTAELHRDVRLFTVKTDRKEL